MRSIDNVMLSEKQFRSMGTLNTVMTIQICIERNKKDFQKQ